MQWYWTSRDEKQKVPKHNQEFRAVQQMKLGKAFVAISQQVADSNNNKFDDK
jgi:hypothetical protein